MIHLDKDDYLKDAAAGWTKSFLNPNKKSIKIRAESKTDLTSDIRDAIEAGVKTGISIKEALRDFITSKTRDPEIKEELPIEAQIELETPIPKPTPKPDDPILSLITNPSNGKIYLEPVIDSQGQIYERSMINPSEISTTPYEILKEITQSYLKFYPDAVVFDEKSWRESLLQDYEAHRNPSDLSPSQILSFKNINICKRNRNEIVLFGTSTFLSKCNHSQLRHVISHMTYDENDLEALNGFAFSFIIALGAFYNVIVQTNHRGLFEEIFGALFTKHPLILKSCLTNEKISMEMTNHNRAPIVRNILVGYGFKYSFQTMIHLFSAKASWVIEKELPNMDLTMNQQTLIETIISTSDRRDIVISLKIINLIHSTFVQTP